MNPKTPRRQAPQSAAALMILPSAPARTYAANEELHIGVTGVRGMGGVGARASRTRREHCPNSTAANPTATPRTGFGVANMYLGVSTYTAIMVRGFYYMRSGETALYLQDNYRITPA